MEQDEVIVKQVELFGRKFTLYDPPGYAVDKFLTTYYDEDMTPIREKVPEANLEVIKMCFRLKDEEVKELPTRIYYSLLAEAVNFFKTLTEGVGGDSGKK